MSYQPDSPLPEVLRLSWSNAPIWGLRWAQFLWNWLRVTVLPWPEVLSLLQQSPRPNSPISGQVTALPRFPRSSHHARVAADLTRGRIMLQHGYKIMVVWLTKANNDTDLPREVWISAPSNPEQHPFRLAADETEMRLELPLQRKTGADSSLIERPPAPRFAFLVGVLAAEILWLIFSPIPFFYLGYDSHPHPQWMKDIGHAVARYDFLLNLAVFLLVSTVINLCLLGETRAPLRIRIRSMGVVISGFVFLELVQIAIPQRNFDLMDILAASIGAVLATLPWTKAEWLERTPPDDSSSVNVV